MRDENAERLEDWARIDVLKKKLRTLEEELAGSTPNRKVAWMVAAGVLSGFVAGFVVMALGG